MKAPRLTYALAVMMVLTLIGGCRDEGGSATTSEAARLVAISGTVTVNEAGASKDQALNKGDVVAVKGDGFARVQFADGSRMLVFYDPSRKKAGVLTIGGERTRSGVQTMLVKLASGVCAFLVPPKRPKPIRFEIEGSSSITAIHGTEGKVAIVAGGDVVALKDGTVEVKGTGAAGAVKISAGQSVFVGADSAPSSPTPYNYLTPGEKLYYSTKIPDIKTF